MSLQSCTTQWQLRLHYQSHNYSHKINPLKLHNRFPKTRYSSYSVTANDVSPKRGNCIIQRSQIVGIDLSLRSLSLISWELPLLLLSRYGSNSRLKYSQYITSAYYFYFSHLADPQFDRHIASSSSLLLVVRSPQSYTVSRKNFIITQLRRGYQVIRLL